MKKEQLATFTDDFVFGTTLRRNKKLCIRLIEMILDIKIKDIEYVGTQKSIDMYLDGKGVRLDVYVDDGTGTVYDLEMQTKISADLPRRSRYYQSMIDQELIESGGNYRDLKRSFVIFICTKDPIGEGRSIYRFEKLDVYDPECKLNDGTVTVFLNAKGKRQGLDPELSNFLDYLTDNIPKDEFTQELDEKVKDINKDPQWRKQYMDLAYKMKEIRLEGREEGRKEGIEKGLKKGLKKGREEGKKEGMIKAMIELVNAKLLASKDAAEHLGLSEEAFMKLMKQY